MEKKFTSRTSWREKLEKPQEPKIVKVPPKMSRFGGDTMLIPTPLLVDELVRKVSNGQLVTVSDLRRRLAEEFSVDVTCPLTTGIFLRIAAEEDRANGRKRITPYWRVVKDDGSLNPKFPGGIESQTRYLKAEGFKVSRKTKTPRVENFEPRLVHLS